ncbi:MAG: ribosome-associated translation inhibitor RaiA [Verrucomicrobiales bacterium]|nr:ribosome-associated translation inhibitor RaiA [Verrucomicrobiales bacterium]
MQVANVNLPITVTGRHTSVTEAMRDHALQKVQGLHLDYPKIIEAKVILDVENNLRHVAEIVLHCANHITIEADTSTENMYTSIDETIHKIARQMRKYKTRMLKSHRPKDDITNHLPEGIDGESFIDSVAFETPHSDGLNGETYDEAEEFDTAFLVHREKYKVRPLDQNEAAEELEAGKKPFIVFNDTRSGKLSVLFRREDGDYGLIMPEE